MSARCWHSQVQSAHRGCGLPPVFICHRALGAIEGKRTIDIDKFVPKDEIDELYLNNPYYIAPDGEVGQQAFAVIREAIRKEGMVAIGKVAFTSREHIIALEARGKGLLGITLRYP